MPVRVTQGGRAVGSTGVAPEAFPWEPAAGAADAVLARSVGGQVRLKPALTERVGWPQAAQ
jgi:hypothetical protein